MATIDQHVTWRKVEERLAVETDPVLRRNLELLLQHMKAEASLDLEQLMATVSEHARYENFGPLGSVIEGKAAVEAFYRPFAASGTHKLQMAIDRLVGPDGLFVGEDSYSGRDGFDGIADRKIDPADIALYAVT